MAERAPFDVDEVEPFGVKLSQRDARQNAEVFQVLVHGLPLAETSHVMDARVERASAAAERLQTAADGAVFLHHADLHPLLREDGAAGQSAHAAADDDHVIATHRAPPFLKM